MYPNYLSSHGSYSRTWATIAGILAAGIVFSFAMISTPEAHAQRFNVIYNFTGGADGSQPLGGVAMDAAGNLFGTTYIGGYTHHPATAGNDCYPNGCGMIFELTKSGSTWTFTSLYGFVGGADGYQATAPLTVGPDGAVYGTARFGGTGCYNGQYAPLGCGIVYKISTTAGGGWRETILYRFKGPPDGEGPWNSQVIFDSARNIYVTTLSGGSSGDGTTVKLLPAPGEWSETILHNFPSENGDGVGPDGGLVFDDSGRLYGTTFAGGSGGGHCAYCGTVYQLTPGDLGWTERILYTFRGGADGETPLGGLVFDHSGHLYGTTNGLYYPSNDHPPLGTGGCVFMLTPSGDDWTFELLHSFIARPGYPDGGPNGNLALERESRKIVAAVVGLGQSLGLSTVAFYTRRRFRPPLHSICSNDRNCMRDKDQLQRRLQN
jgi:hypothetical protein